MRIITLDQIQSAVTFPDAINAVRDAFIAYSDGLIEQPDPMQILFKDKDGSFFGDCHAKAAQQLNHPYFVIKVATGFYKNENIGLPVNNGLVLIMSAQTGRPIAILQDDGWLTQMRTACAGALAAELKPVKSSAGLGIIGTGTQAFLQAKAITQHLGLQRVFIFGRSSEKAHNLCHKLSQELGIDAIAMNSVRDVCQASEIIVTTTPSTTPIIFASDIPKNIHIIAVGSDSPGKSEICSSITKLASIVATDNHTQSLHHGDFGTAVKAGVIGENDDVSLCDLLAGKLPSINFSPPIVSLVDLTGIGAQDLAIASLVLANLKL